MNKLCKVSLEVDRPSHLISASNFFTVNRNPTLASNFGGAFDQLSLVTKRFFSLLFLSSCIVEQKANAKKSNDKSNQGGLICIKRAFRRGGKQGHRMATDNVPQHLRDCIPSRPTHMHNTGKPPFFQLPTTNTSLMLNSPLYQAADTFNALPAILQSASSLTSFKNGAALFLLTCQCTCSKHTSK